MAADVTNGKEPPGIGARSLGIISATALTLALSACQSRDGPSDYPDLRAVTSPDNPNSALEERRAIVRNLIRERDLARHRQAVIRHRSGLSDVPPDPAPPSTDLTAEDIVRDAPVEKEVNAREDENDNLYQDRTQFDDGTLNDFIRRLKRETTPVIVEEPVGDPEDRTAPSDEPATQSWHRTSEPLILLAMAPSIHWGGEPESMIRLAASEQGWGCSLFGWMVAWSNACLDEEAETSSTDDATSADVEDGRTEQDSSNSTNNEQAADDQGGGAAGAASQPDEAQDELTESDDVESGSANPITQSFERLVRRLRDGGRPEDSGSSLRERSLSYEADALKEPVDETPLPLQRPERSKDLRIVRNDNVFEFRRTPIPAFKPVVHDPATVIYAAEGNARSTPAIFVPSPRPPMLLTELEAGAGDGDGTSDQPDPNGIGDSQGEPPSTPIVVLPEDLQRGVLDSEVILFETASAALPKGVEVRLQQMLNEARARGGKLYIYSQAGIGSLAMQRARAVGLAFVRLDATADLIDYDIVVNREADHVEIVLKIDDQAPDDTGSLADPEQTR